MRRSAFGSRNFTYRLLAVAILGSFVTVGACSIMTIYADSLLQVAARRGVAPAVPFLVWLGADIHADDDAPLWIASVNGHSRTVKVLLDKGADIHAGEDFALRYAALAGHLDVVSLMLDRGADAFAQENGALRWARQEGHTEVEQYLLRHIRQLDQQSANEISIESQTTSLGFLLRLDVGAAAMPRDDV